MDFEKNIIYNDPNLVIINHIEELGEREGERPKDCLFFVFTERGAIHLCVDGRDYDLQSGEVLLCFPRQNVQDYRASEDYQGAVVLIKASLVKDLVHSSMQSLKDFFYLHENPVLHLNENVKYLFEHYILLLQYRYCHSTESYNTDIVNAILQAMLYEMMNLIKRDNHQPEDTRIIRQGERLFKSFLQMLIEDKVHSRSVSDYADRLCVTSKYLSAVCKQLTGRTASTWINEYVMKEIVHQLRFTDKCIKEIALELGFPNVSFFGKYVKNQLGVSPSEYRKMKGDRA